MRPARPSSKAGRPVAGAAEGDDRPFGFAERGGKGARLLLGRLAGDDRDMPLREAVPGRRGLQLGGAWLIGAFAVGPVVDDALEAGGGDLGHFLGQDLRAD